MAEKCIHGIDQRFCAVCNASPTTARGRSHVAPSTRRRRLRSSATADRAILMSALEREPERLFLPSDLKRETGVPKSFVGKLLKDEDAVETVKRAGETRYRSKK